MNETRINLAAWVLGALALGCALIGCNAANNEPVVGNAPGNAPAEAAPRKAETPAPHPFAEWTTHAPLRTEMRSMWIDCGLIIGNSYHPEVADLGMLRDIATDLARRAGSLAGYWQTIRDANRESANAVKAGDWSLAAEQNNLAHRTCGACHYQYWPWQGRSFTPDTLKGWRDSQDVFGDEPWGEQVFTAPAPVRASMQKMAGMMLAAEAAIAEKQDGEALRLTGELHKPVEKQLDAWRGIERRALNIARLASEGKPEEVGEQYKAITQACRDCHATSSEGRGLDPLPWPGR